MATKQRSMMRIGALARVAGVSPQTIHYYVREGLLPTPTKTAPNMAYYGQEYVADIRLIKELQEQRYLPLSVIKLVLQAKRQGKDVRDLQDMRLSLEDLFRPLGAEEEQPPLTLVELVAVTGLPVGTLEALEEIGLLMPSLTPEGKRYDGLDVRAALATKKLLDLGLTPADLGYYRNYVEALRTETQVIGTRFVDRARRGSQLSGSDLKTTLDDLKAALVAKVYRQAALGFRKGVTADTIE